MRLTQDAGDLVPLFLNDMRERNRITPIFAPEDVDITDFDLKWDGNDAVLDNWNCIRQLPLYNLSIAGIASHRLLALIPHSLCYLDVESLLLTANKNVLVELKKKIGQVARRGGVSVAEINDQQERDAGEFPTDEEWIDEMDFWENITGNEFEDLAD